MYLLEKFTFRGKNVGPKYSNEKEMSAFSFIEFVQINKSHSNTCTIVKNGVI